MFLQKGAGPHRNSAMNTPLTAVAILSAVLASGMGTASAADRGSAMSSRARTSAKRSMPGNRIRLTDSRKKLIWSEIGRRGFSQTRPANFTPIAGATLPGQVALKPLPLKLTRQVNKLKTYEYAVFKGEILIVDPTNKKIVDVIAHQT